MVEADAVFLAWNEMPRPAGDQAGSREWVAHSKYYGTVSRVLLIIYCYVANGDLLPTTYPPPPTSTAYRYGSTTLLVQ